MRQLGINQIKCSGRRNKVIIGGSISGALFLEDHKYRLALFRREH